METTKEEYKETKLKSSSFQTFIKKYDSEISNIVLKYKQKGLKLYKAGIKDILYLLWEEAFTDEEAIKKLKKLLKRLLGWPSLLSFFKLAPSKAISLLKKK